MIDLNTLIVRSENPLSSTLDGQEIILHIDTGKYYGTDEVGSYIWTALERPRSVAGLCKMVQAEFEVDEETCRQDVLGFLNDLLQAKLVQIVAGQAD